MNAQMSPQLRKPGRTGSVICLFLGIAPAFVLADVSRSGLDESRNFSDSGVDYTITYTDTGGSSDRISTADVDNLESFAKTSYDRLVDVMNFRSPYLSTVPAYEFIVKDDWWYAEPACVVLDAPSIRAWPADDSRVVFFHERFHTVQRNYKCDVSDCNSGYIGSTFGKWVSEGTADAMMDKGYPDLDDKTSYPYYEGSARNFLDSPNTSLFDREYECCLWWNYLMEQLGSTTSEPHYGVDFMRSFWNRAASNGTSGTAASKLALEQVIGSKGRTLKSLFLDFSICNYTRDFDVGTVAEADRYFYVDEQTQPILTSVPTTNLGLPGSGSSSVKEWATRYFEAGVDATNECLAVGFRGVSDGDVMAFAAVAIDRDDKVIEIRKGVGTEFTAAFFNSPARPIDKICGIAIGFEEAETFDYDLDAGVPKLTIIRPLFAAPAYPGPAAEPGNIVVAVSVTGVPGLTPDEPMVSNPSMAGLQADDFEVTVGGLDAPILDAAYVGGEWQLLVDAPVQAADGLYDLEVILCPDAGGISARSQKSVLYGDIKFHHVVVLDISGSMEIPTSAKMDAAKQAAQFYIDAVNDGDKLTVVTFSGNGAECDEDAVNLKGAAGMLDATGANRTTLRNRVEILTGQNLTSIGDGLWHAQDALDLEADPTAIDTILLLTDGKENESRYWAQNPDGCGRVDTRIIPAGTIVNTLAFGDGAETDLCQDISTATAGDYRFVPVIESSPAHAAQVAPSRDFTMDNQLTLNFLGGLENTARLQRICLQRAELRRNDAIEIRLDQPYDRVTSPRIYVGWSESSNVQVTVLDPNGVDITTYSIVHTEKAHHVVIHPQVPLIKGTYRMQLRETDGVDLEVFAGISGKPGNDLDFQCRLSPLRNGGPDGRPEHDREGFELGMPVDINLVARDLRGPLRDLDVTVEVILPDGRPACDKPLRMFDDGGHVDGAEKDGRYGLRYTKTPLGSNSLQKDRSETVPSKPGDGGTYQVIIRVNGKDSFGVALARTFEKAFQVYQRIEIGNGGDQDLDGIPDTWERHYGTDFTKDDSGEDPDNDGLTHLEEFREGCCPFDADTDDGGASDGSEVASGLCPLCPDDDPFPGLAEVALITTSDSHGDDRNLKPKALLLHFPDHPSYSAMEIYRNTLPAGLTSPANLVDIVDMTKGTITDHYDEGLDDGRRYFYKLRARGADGTTVTPFSRTIDAVARADWAQAFGSIQINSGTGRSDRTRVAVKLLPGDDAVEYRLKQTPFSGAEPWLPIPAHPIVPFQLIGVGNGDLAQVYVQFRTANGIESRRVDDSVLISTTTDNDGDGPIDSLDLDDDNDGLSDADELFVHCTNPYMKDTDGDGFGDREEVDEGSDPRNVDSVPDRDGDGYSDRLEQLLGSNPNDPDSTPDIGLAVVYDGVGNLIRVSFDTVAGVEYRPRVRDNLDLRIVDWPDLSSPIEGDGTRKTLTTPRDAEVEFYAVTMRLLPLD